MNIFSGIKRMFSKKNHPYSKLQLENIRNLLSSSDEEMRKLGQALCHSLRINYFVVHCSPTDNIGGTRAVTSSFVATNGPLPPGIWSSAGAKISRVYRNFYSLELPKEGDIAYKIPGISSMYTLVKVCLIDFKKKSRIIHGYKIGHRGWLTWDTNREPLFSRRR